nr:hypothetical protein [Porphyromonas gulae]
MGAGSKNFTRRNEKNLARFFSLLWTAISSFSAPKIRDRSCRIASKSSMNCMQWNSEIRFGSRSRWIIE